MHALLVILVTSVFLAPPSANCLSGLEAPRRLPLFMSPLISSYRLAAFDGQTDSIQIPMTHLSPRRPFNLVSAKIEDRGEHFVLTLVYDADPEFSELSVRVASDACGINEAGPFASRDGVAETSFTLEMPEQDYCGIVVFASGEVAAAERNFTARDEVYVARRSGGLSLADPGEYELATQGHRLVYGFSAQGVVPIEYVGETGPCSEWTCATPEERPDLFREAIRVE